jgi:glycosyltransferase involved in cell wall biosynthesis
VRILVVNTADVGGGAERIAAQLVDGYRSAGHHVTFAVGHRHSSTSHVVELPNEARRNFLARALQAASVRPRSPRLQQAMRVAARLAEPARALALSAGAEDMDFPGMPALLELASDVDVVHLHNLHGRFFDLRLLPALARCAPLVLTLHDEWVLTGHCAYTSDCPRFTLGCGRCPDLARYPSVHADRTQQNRALKRRVLAEARPWLTAPSGWLLRQAQQSLAGLPLDMRQVPHGVDTSVFRANRAAARAALGIAHNARVVTYDASASRGFRRPQWAREAVTAWAPVVALEMGSAAESPGPAPGVSYRSLGRLTSEQVATALQAADAYVHPAVADNHPTAVLEALACGTFVVANGVGGIPELLAGGGGIATANGAGALAVALAQWDAKPFRALEARSIDRMTADYLDVLEAARLRSGDLRTPA